MEEAEEVVKIMMNVSVHPNIIIFNTLIDGYCLQGRMKEATKVFHSTKDWGLNPNIISYNSLINGYCKKGRLDKAWHLFLEVPRKGLEHNAVSYSTMIHGFFRGKISDGWKLFKDMEARQYIQIYARIIYCWTRCAGLRR